MQAEMVGIAAFMAPVHVWGEQRGTVCDLCGESRTRD